MMLTENRKWQSRAFLPVEKALVGCTLLFSFIWLVVYAVYIPLFRRMLDDFGSSRERSTEIVASYWFAPAVVATVLVLEMATHKFVTSSLLRKVLYAAFVLSISFAMLYFAYGLRLPLMTADSILAE